MKLNPNFVGLAVALFMAVFHAIWSLLVWFGVAQAFIDFIFNLHFITPLMLINEFSFVRALGLLAVVSAIGYFYGYIFALLWNALHKRQQ